jgi:pimeloyl-ACP methyl ester carboxylesterase
MMRRVVQVLAVLAGALLVAAGSVFAQTDSGDDSGAPLNPESAEIIWLEYQGRVSASAIDAEATPLFDGFAPGEPVFPAPKPRFAADVYRVRFWSLDFDGSPVEVEASLYVPISRLPLRAPVLAFGSGTTGLGDHCAPSLEQPEVRRLGYYRANMLSYAGQGFITIFPDYTGFNNPDMAQRYFSAAAEGYLMLDSLRVARAIVSDPEHAFRTLVRPATENFTAGYSQGGHAALAAADMAATYAPELNLVGAIGFGSTNSVEMLMREAAYYTPEIIYTYLQMYGPERVRVDELLQERWIPTLEADVLRMCVDEFQYFYPFDGEPLYTERFFTALHERRLDEEFPEFKAILDENETGLSGHGIPVLLVEGVQDIIVTPPAQREYADRLRESGSRVDLLEIDGARHRHTRPSGFLASVAFMRGVIEVGGRD